MRKVFNLLDRGKKRKFSAAAAAEASHKNIIQIANDFNAQWH